MRQFENGAEKREKRPVAVVVLILSMACFMGMAIPAWADSPLLLRADSTETTECMAFNFLHNEYFVVYSISAAPVGLRYWEGIRVDQNGTALAAPVVLPLLLQNSMPNIVYNPDNDEYMLVASNSGVFGSPGVDGFLLSRDGVAISSFQVLSGEYHAGDGAQAPQVVYNSIAHEFLVTAALDTGSSSGFYEIYAQRVDEHGMLNGARTQVTSAGPFLSIDSHALEYGPVVSAETPNGRYLVVWVQGPGWDPWAIMLDSFGAPIITLWNCSGTPVPFSAEVPADYGDQNYKTYHPDIAYGAPRGEQMFFVVWEDHNNEDPDQAGVEWFGVWGVSIDATQLMYCSPGGNGPAMPISTICSHLYYPTGDHWFPQVVYSEQAETFLVAWQETPDDVSCNIPSLYHIRGGYVDWMSMGGSPRPGNTILSRATGTWPGTEDPERPVLAAGLAGSALVAWSDNRNSGSGNWRDLYTNVYSPSSELIDLSTPELKGADLSTGVAWGDYDGDGDHDLHISNWGGPNRLFRNDAGTLADVSGPPTEDFGLGFGAAWGDINNDGDLDLYLANDGANRLFENLGGGSFVDATSPAVADTGIGFGVSTADYDNDGDLDIYLSIVAAPNRLYRNDGPGGYVDVATGPLADASDTQAGVWGDYDNDGDQDLYLANSGTANKLLRNNGNGTFTDVTPAILADAGLARGATWADYNNDGNLDLYVANISGQNYLFMNDFGTFFDDTYGPLLDTRDTHSSMWADYDIDGDLDLYLTNTNGSNSLIRNDSGQYFDVTRWPYNDPGFSGGAAWADYDDDGDPDLVVANSLWQPNRLFRNEQFSSYAWLQVDLEGTTSNRFGVGARIRVVSNGRQQIREVSAGSGYCSMNSLTAEFGFGIISYGGPEPIDTIQVSWPSGAVQETTDVLSNRRLTLVEPSITVGVGDGSDSNTPRMVLAYPNRPNPFNPVTTLRYDLPERASVTLAIYNIGGRMVRRLIDAEEKTAGTHTVVWDGRDDRGSSVASGIYIYQFDSGHYRKTHRMTLIR